eukprot:CAMPEP_0185741110 /NCGR_PEP_ID=MMETSP1171-20130828/38782_1 /TAXON_ID=374046 /ORGANISM="Helicotheca tamensis, Strain CCMP826" /LENGTH=307 /DNA_ID=CAMNT_0028413055 /DNA_START=44 /DNA_END=967 /DNA_ORIENTATION=-
MIPDITNTTQIRMVDVGDDDDDDAESISTCPSTCSSSSSTASTSVEGHAQELSSSSLSQRCIQKKMNRKAALDDDNNKDIIISQLRAELARAKAEAKHNLFLVEKLIEENQMIRQEANDANARTADTLEEEKVEQQSPSFLRTSAMTMAWDFGKTWHENAAKAIQALKEEEVVSTTMKTTTCYPKITDTSSPFSSEEKIGLIAHKDVNQEVRKNGGIKRAEATTKPLTTNDNMPIEEKYDVNGFQDESPSPYSSACKSLKVLFRRNSSSVSSNSGLVAVTKQQQEIAKSLLWESFDLKCIVENDDTF